MDNKARATPAAQHKARLDAVMGFLRQSDWKPDADYDFDSLVARVVSHFDMRKDRAEALVAKAARRLRGEVVSMGGRKQTRLVLEIGDTIHMRGDDWTIRAFLADGHVRLGRIDENGANLQTGIRVEKTQTTP